MTLPDLVGDRAEIASLRRRVDLHDRLDVVLRNDRVADVVRVMLARPPRIGDAAAPPAVIGTVSSALRESIWYCGVCMTIE